MPNGWREPSSEGMPMVRIPSIHTRRQWTRRRWSGTTNRLWSVFLVARPVVYQDTPSIAEANAWVSCILSHDETCFQNLFIEYLHVKTCAWSYEKEWRIAVPGRRPGDAELYGDYGFNPRELTAIYFGPKCPQKDRSDLLALLAHGLEHVQAHEMAGDAQQAKLVSRAVAK
jgi:hypothetical protein